LEETVSQRRLAVVLVAAAALLLVATSGLAAAKPHQILEFDTMVGVPPALTGATNPIRGINGGGIPWTIGSARGELTVSGHLEIRVSGLVFADGPNIGTNTVTSFRAIVSCLDSSGATVNVATGSFPATTGPASSGGGNANIEADLSLPSPCLAPLVFVTSPGLSWFASTGG
jgi:hypothetical protein